MSEESHQPIVRTKHGSYVYKEEKKALKSIEQLSYSKRELRLLGILRPELKEKYGEASARVIHALLLRLRTDEKASQFSNQELIVAAKQLADTTLNLEQANTGNHEKIDWSKFNTDSFNKPLTNTDSSTK